MVSKRERIKYKGLHYKSMKFGDKYILSEDSLKPENSKKVVIGNDAYAVVEMLQNLINQLEKNRVSING